MSNLYSNIMELCEKQGISGYRMCKDAGIQPSILTDLKMGRQKGLSAVNAEKVASYFGISVRDLLGASPISASNVRDSVVLQGNTGNNTVYNGGMGAAPSQLTEQEEEVLRIFRSLGMRKKTAVLSYLYELEDGGTADRCD